jgi:hypothetical protein
MPQKPASTAQIIALRRRLERLENAWSTQKELIQKLRQRVSDLEARPDQYIHLGNYIIGMSGQKLPLADILTEGPIEDPDNPGQILRMGLALKGNAFVRVQNDQWLVVQDEWNIEGEAHDDGYWAWTI